jgi:hypothetical protein
VSDHHAQQLMPGHWPSKNFRLKQTLSSQTAPVMVDCHRLSSEDTPPAADIHPLLTLAASGDLRAIVVVIAVDARFGYVFSPSCSAPLPLFATGLGCNSCLHHQTILAKTASSTRVQPRIFAIDPAPAEDVEEESAGTELVACEVPDVSSPDTDRLSVGAVTASVRVRVDTCAVVAGLAGLVLPATDCSEKSVSELLAVGDSLLLLCIGTWFASLVGSSLGSSVDSSIDSSVVITRTDSAVA